MSHVVLRLASGERCEIAAPPGQTLMQAAKSGGVPGVEADCGGSMVCGTCHVIVDEAWFARLPPPCEMEQMILEGVPEPHPRARLSCQLRMEPSLAGLAASVPATQR
ncbi:2Fe-2S iron-sulfur cluster-binding protein [Pelomonas sp. KK5]|uniref:2Fe-2S iron-sulfur cluster-binding protein n=1 Tax=Pelomonas sp. KK5 TaxID=1855730 RepID=UPI00097BACD3|nr:2Fe-2S iron-sulfur cluster-binding protein [Pelomonas sp. KK5]